VSIARAFVILATASLLSAGVLAFVSRAPASIRTDSPGPDATDPDLGARFTPDEIRRGGAYNGPSYLAFFLETALTIVVLLVLARGPLARWVEWTSGWPGGWVTSALAAALLVVVVGTFASLPLSFVRGYAMEHAWGRSTQDVPGWVGDVGRSVLVGTVTSAVAAVAFFGLVRWQPRTWWLWGWAAFSLLTAILVFLWPIVVAPLFNKFTPLEDRALAARIESLAADAHVDIDQVLVADASRRSTAENAYVAGLGSTKRMVLYDTLLDAGGERQTLFVVAHELGHARENHVLKGVAASAVGLLAGFGVLSLLSQRESLWGWAGAAGVGDVKALPLVALFATVASILVLPASNGLSRSFEARADEIAVELTHDSDAAIQSFRRLALTNLADLRPPAAAVWLFYSHPPIPDRIRAVAESGTAP
jgi:Zn-dependent protease with chaperone function